MTDSFLIKGPALISFSGGRTSAYMLWRVIQAHEGVLPSDVIVAYANTGKERPETLEFVRQCGERWNVPISLVEWRATRSQAENRTGLARFLKDDASRWAMIDDAGYEEVGHNSMARNGEPFAALIAMKQYTPNAMARFCTEELKVSTIRRFMLDLGYDSWSNVVGLRSDEGKRVHRRRAAEADEKNISPYRSVFPLYDAGVDRDMVDEFWADQPFDLGIPSGDGNCDGCFLKSRKRLMWTERKWPGTLGWWANGEVLGKGQFVTEWSMQSLIETVKNTPLLPGLDVNDDHDVECGLICASY